MFKQRALFRDLIKRSCCSNSARKQRAEKIRKAEARVIATRALAEKPNSFLLGQVMVMSNLASNKVVSGSMQLNLLGEGGDEPIVVPGPSSA
ncbi:hypothetical protein OESDEN_05023 [Oesophagostomum dentatum]|uniref:Uncharacterized protein n=1 Tax=Oesophagostomum dentatum TaxID=61180 RepID=A0A0B1TBV9_OESDE|nr:hypothetical protein OESDEN_05023 [Oesophagostomum dentatum]